MRDWGRVGRVPVLTRNRSSTLQGKGWNVRDRQVRKISQVIRSHLRRLNPTRSLPAVLRKDPCQ